MSDTNDESYSDDDEEEELDPRIQDELEKLNAATNSINHLEAELDEARAVFRQTLAGATYQLNGLAQKLGKCVEKSRPFYESYRQLRQAHYMLQKSTNQFERATGMHVAAKTRVLEAETRVFGGGEKRAFDTALQEMLNQSTIEVNEAEKMKRDSWKTHQEDLKAYRKLELKVKQLLKKLKSVVEKAKPYFEMKSEFDRHLWQLKLRVDSIHIGLSGAKENYSACLKSLEVISDEIHEKRKSKHMDAVLAKLHERESGVGAESSTEDEASLSTSNLDLDFDSSLKLDNFDRLAVNLPTGAGAAYCTEEGQWASIPPTIVLINSENDAGTILSPYTRSVAGCEGEDKAQDGALPSSSRRAVYGHESDSDDDDDNSNSNEFTPEKVEEDRDSKENAGGTNRSGLSQADTEKCDDNSNNSEFASVNVPEDGRASEESPSENKNDLGLADKTVTDSVSKSNVEPAEDGSCKTELNAQSSGNEADDGTCRNNFDLATSKGIESGKENDDPLYESKTESVAESD